MSGFPIPSDDSFAEWEAPMWNKVTNACGSSPSFSGSYGLKLGLGIFDKLVAWRTPASERLESVLAGDRNVGSYISPFLIGQILWIMIALVLLIITIISALAISPSIRACFSRWFCGSCRSRSRLRMKAVAPHNRSFLMIANVLGASLIIAAFIYIITLSLQGILGTNRGVCGVWLGLYGHYFGLDKITRNLDTTEIAWSWNGTHTIMEQLRKLDHRLEPGINNPVYTDLLDRYGQLKVDANDQASKCRANVADLVHTSQSWNETWYEWMLIPTAAGTKDDKKRWRMLATEASIGKGEVYKSELDDTLAEGWIELERLVDLYSGPESQLMRKASDAVKDTFLTISDVDAVVGALTQKWNDVSGAISGLLLTFISLNIILISVALVCAGCTLYLTIDLARRLRNDKFPDKFQRSLWATAYVVFALLAGLSFLLAALEFLVFTVGADVCPILTMSIFEQGRWHLLGDTILRPNDPMNVDVNIVFDTCLRSDGSGDVASALGLDGRIAELADDTDAALADITCTRDRLLNREEKTTRAEVLTVAFKDLLELQTKDKDKAKSQTATGPAFFNSTEWIRFDYDDYDRIGLRNVLCVVPKLMEGVKDAAQDCLYQGIQYNIAPHNHAMDVLLDMTNMVHRLADANGKSLSHFPKMFCSDQAIRQGHPCANFSEDAYMLSPSVYSDSTWKEGSGILAKTKTWADEIQNAVPGATTYGEPTYQIGAKLLELTFELGDISGLTAQTVKQLPASCSDCVNPQRTHIACPEGTDDCRLDEARQVALAEVYVKASAIVPDTLTLFSLYDQYVDDQVTPIMESLVADANAVTDGSNCQFEGTAFLYGSVMPLCLNAFPSFGLNTVILACASAVFLLFSIHTWKWYAYMEDLALECQDDEKQYDAQKMPAAMASAMSDAVAIYNLSPTYIHPVITNLSHATGEQINFQGSGSSQRSKYMSAEILSPPPISPRPNYEATIDRSLLRSEHNAISFHPELMVPLSAAR